MILAPLQKLPINVGNLGKIIVAIGFELLPKVQKSPNLGTLVSSTLVYCPTLTKHYFKFGVFGSGCVAQLVEQLLPIPEVRGSNPVIGKNLFKLNI